MLGLEALTGTLDDFGFEDYLNGKGTLFINQLVDFFFYYLDIWGFVPTRSSGHHAKHTFYMGQLKFRLSPAGVAPKNYLHSRRGQILNLMVHEAPRPSDQPLLISSSCYSIENIFNVNNLSKSVMILIF